jgi:tRNA uridine 5-carbamoylmethylation protein Kti12
VDNSLQKQYEDYFDLFSREGWKLLMEDIDNMIVGLDSLDYVSSLEELHNYKGQLTILKRIRGFENAIEAAYAEYTESEAE